MSQFVPEHVNPHRLGQHEKNHKPARRARQQRNPDCVRAVAGAQHEPERARRPGANRSSRTAMMNLIHFGTPPEFRIQNSEARLNR